MEYPNHVRSINISDPFVLVDKKSGKYYVYSAYFNLKNTPKKKNGNGFYAIISEDLVHWSEPVLVFNQGDFWGGLDYWAPECHIWNGKYYLISSFRAEGRYRACQCLVADSPLGPFQPIKKDPVTPKGWQCLDGTLYVDKKGKPWMIFCHEWLQVYDGQIAAVPLSDDLGEAIGDPVILFYASDAPWRSGFVKRNKTDNNGFVTDGPFLHRMADGSLIMLWSNFNNDGYVLGYAKSLSGEILGPWQQVEEPLYGHDGGHGMLFYTFDGQLMMCMHGPNEHTKKRILLFQMMEDQGKLRIINEVTGNWYHLAKGPADKHVYAEDCIEEPCFTRLASGNIPPAPEKIQEEKAKEEKTE